MILFQATEKSTKEKHADLVQETRGTLLAFSLGKSLGGEAMYSNGIQFSGFLFIALLLSSALLADEIKAHDRALEKRTRAQGEPASPPIGAHLSVAEAREHARAVSTILERAAEWDKISPEAKRLVVEKMRDLFSLPTLWVCDNASKEYKNLGNTLISSLCALPEETRKKVNEYQELLLGNSARRELEAAVSSGNPEKLLKVATRLRGLDAGSEALFLLSENAMDQGKFDLALLYLDSLLLSCTKGSEELRAQARLRKASLLRRKGAPSISVSADQSRAETTFGQNSYVTLRTLSSDEEKNSCDEAWLKKNPEVVQFFKKYLPRDRAKILMTLLESEEERKRELGRHLFATGAGEALKYMGEIVRVASNSGKSFKEAVNIWLADKNRDSGPKAEYLRQHITSPDFEKLIQRLPDPEAIRKELNKRNSFATFKKAGGDGGLSEKATDLLNPTSFEFVPFEFPKEGTKVKLGSPPDEVGRWGPEEDQREVTFKKSFEIQATEVTEAQWALVMGRVPGSFRWTEPVITKVRGADVVPNRPVTQISWDDAQDFIKKLNEQDPEYTYRLPTDAEWEYAARGGVQNKHFKEPYAFGGNETLLKQYRPPSDKELMLTHDVASLRSNNLGLYDMHGSAWEWVQDWFTTDTTELSGTDPQGPSSGSARVIRGGSSGSSAASQRSASRGHHMPLRTGERVGFRLARTPKK